MTEVFITPQGEEIVEQVRAVASRIYQAVFKDMSRGNRDLEQPAAQSLQQSVMAASAYRRLIVAAGYTWYIMYIHNVTRNLVFLLPGTCASLNL